MSQNFGSESVDSKKSSRNQRKSTEVASIECVQQSLVKHGDIEDPRVERTRETSTLRHLSNCNFSNNCWSAGMERH